MKLKEIFVYFLRLGLLGFGGPIALVAQIQKELIEKEKWQSKEEFIQALALIKSMPGPLAFSVASYLGTIRAGFWGGQIAGWSLVFPAFCIMILLASTYDSFSQVPVVVQILGGMQAAALALIIFSIKSLAQGYFQKIFFWILLAAAFALTFFGVSEPLVILGLGVSSLLIYHRPSVNRTSMYSMAVLPIFADEKIRDMVWICLKTGALVFGSGLAMVPFLEQGFVQEMHWMTHSQFMDALAFGQMTPGPVLITVTFVGYKVAGFLGALLATVAIFLTSSIHMTTWFPRMTGWLSKQQWVPHFVFGALAAVIGTLIYVTGKLLISSSIGQIVITVLAVVALWRFKLPSWLLILCGGVCGFLFLR